jgi:O-antigen/teichoic acid export membrane protein
VFNETLQEEQAAISWWRARARLGNRGSSGRDGEVVRGSAVLVFNVLIGAVGSFAFWLVVARLDPARIVGTAAALTTVLTFLNYATSLGLPIMVPRYAAGPSTVARRMFCCAIVATTASSFVGVLLYAAIAPGSSLDALYHWAGEPRGLAILFVLLVGFSLAALVDVRLLTLRSWSWLIAKTMFVTVMRFPLLALRPTSGSIGVALFLIGVLPTAFTGLVGATLLTRRGWNLRALPSATLKAAMRFSGVNYVGQLTLLAPTLALPLVVVGNVSKSQYAAFFIAFSITTVVFVVPSTIVQVLLAEGGTRGADVFDQVRMARRLALMFATITTLASPIIAFLIPIAYGHRYLAAAKIVVPLIAMVLLWSLTAIYLTEARITEHSVGTLMITTVFALATLVPAIVLVDAFGLAGVVVTWIVGNVAATSVAVAVHARLRRRIPDEAKGENRCDD